ncbi:BON domain-containing protein [Chitinimonas arctica]|uniref:BON domain-containing protein n=1 Tax=Chitinimonas arctica TaxID=2594795 RepID=A0A516SBP2_9NEIS|nr:BON domain-containing protein [Chitinimonas arctica]QDQ25566.1 BON domain-containing protein [Chitinimonas arctica]
MYKLLIALSLAIMTAFGTTGCAVTSGQSSVGEFVDDTTITTRVKARFAEDKTVSAMRINVETLKGVVQLSGFATSDTEKTHAAQIARNVPDVKDVRNNITIARSN